MAHSENRAGLDICRVYIFNSHCVFSVNMPTRSRAPLLSLWFQPPCVISFRGTQPNCNPEMNHPSGPCGQWRPPVREPGRTATLNRDLKGKGSLSESESESDSMAYTPHWARGYSWMTKMLFLKLNVNQIHFVQRILSNRRLI